MLENKKSILLVDDDTGITETLADILALKGYTVTVANDGHGALAASEKRRFDLALLDITMPGMNGVETLRIMRQKSPSTRFIMMTAHAYEYQIAEALNLGAATVLDKPLDIQELLFLLSTDTPSSCN